MSILGQQRQGLVLFRQGLVLFRQGLVLFVSCGIPVRRLRPAEPHQREGLASLRTLYVADDPPRAQHSARPVPPAQLDGRIAHPSQAEAPKQDEALLGLQPFRVVDPVLAYADAPIVTHFGGDLLADPNIFVPRAAGQDFHREVRRAVVGQVERPGRIPGRQVPIRFWIRPRRTSGRTLSCSRPSPVLFHGLARRVPFRVAGLGVRAPAPGRNGGLDVPLRLPGAATVAVLGPVRDQAGQGRVGPGFPQGPGLGARSGRGPPVTRRCRGRSCRSARLGIGVPEPPRQHPAAWRP